MSKVDKKNFKQFDIDFGTYSIPHLVAGLLGFSDIHNRSALGFRLHWLSLTEKNCFADCKNVGDYYKAYLNHHITGEKRV